jgi:hypothetical protein
MQSLPPVNTTRSPVPNATKKPATKLSSARLDPTKCANPFATSAKAAKTLFSQAYIRGSIPCRLQSTASKHHLQWDKGTESGFSADLLVVCADGLREEVHPYTIMAPMMFGELVERSEGVASMFEPVIDNVVNALRQAMLADSAFGAALKAIDQLIPAAAEVLVPHYQKLIPAMVRKAKDKKHRDNVLATLNMMESVGGKAVTAFIKSKMPTY